MAGHIDKKYLMVFILLAVVVLISIISISTYVNLSNMRNMYIFEAQDIYMLVRSSLDISFRYHFLIERGMESPVKVVMKDISVLPHVVYVAVQSNEGIIMASDNVRKLSDYMGDIWLQDVLYTHPSYRLIEWENRKILEYCGAFRKGEPTIVRIGIDWTEIDRIQKQLYLILIIAVFLVLSIILSGYYFWRISIDYEKRKEREKRIRSSLEMVSTLGHQLRNPLNTMSLIMNNTGEFEYKTEMKKEIEKITNLVNFFIDSVKPVKINMEDIDIYTLIKDKIKDMDILFKEKNINVNIEGEKTICKADKMLLSEIIENIIRNAIDAMDNKGKINIFVSKGCIVFEDNGKGMSDEDLHSIFEPFFTTKKDGTGLGMTAVRRYVDMMNGKIEMESKEGEGTKISIWLQK